jgi:FAD/FMN-containing dehydrogenase/Fe-S oxidoreductase
MSAEVDARVLTDALQRVGVTEVDTGSRRRSEYASDASNYRVVPRAVVFPRHVDEVLATIAACRELSVPLTCRGGGTSIAGNSIGPGVVVDFSRYLNRVLRIDPDASTALVEPGAVLEDINVAASPHGLRFGPDPSTRTRASIGGSLANNACGARALGYGRSVDNVRSIDVATAAGERFTAGSLADAPEWLRGALSGLVRSELALVRTEFGRFPRQVSGYSLEHLLPENGADLARFLVGTEGTLGVTLGATVRLVTAPKATALAVLGYADIVEAAAATAPVLEHPLTALEGFDARLVDVVRRRRGAAVIPDLPRGGAWMFAECVGDTDAEAVAAATALTAVSGCRDSRVLTGPMAAAMWRIREDGAGLGSRTPDNQPAWPGWEDAAVPPARLADYLGDFTALMGEHRLDGLIYGHFGDGCVHARIDFPLARDPREFRAFVVAAAGLVGGYDGSLSGEHGDGRARGELLPLMYSAGAIRAMTGIKRIFDPTSLLNPGVIVDPEPIDGDLRLTGVRPIAHAGGFAYPDDGDDLAAAVHRCVGVGKCRAPATVGVMCPSYQATKDEKDTTRGRARVLQDVVSGRITDGFASAELAESLDLCLACKGCSTDCPTGVDIATYKAESLYRRYRRRVRPLTHYSLGWLPRWLRIVALAPRPANAAVRTRYIAGLAKRCAGIDPARTLPTFAPGTFRRWFKGRPGAAAAGDRPGVLLWVDTFTNHLTPEVGRAAVEVLTDAGYQVSIPDKSVCCGLTWLSTGQLDGARRQLRRTLDALEPALADGVPIVGLEPSCLALLREDARRLLPDDPRARAVAERARSLAELLRDTPGWSAPDLSGVHGVAQPHCHQNATTGWHADAALLRQAGADITPVPGCCGFAGNFGMERGHYDVSVAVARTSLLPAIEAAGRDAVVLTDGFSCRSQVTELAGRPAQHLAEVLAERAQRQDAFAADATSGITR